MITIYECELCHKQYDNEEEALRCENQPEPKPNYKVGDIVYLYNRYHKYNGAKNTEPFAKRTITKVYIENHKACYLLNAEVNTGKGFYVGGTTIWEWGEYRPALEEDFIQIGEMVYGKGEKEYPFDPNIDTEK